jgi:hypothetical protein
MKYLKRYESFYNEDFPAIREEYGKREKEEDEKSGDQGFDKKDNKSQSSDIPAEVETPSMSGSEGGSGHNTSVSSDIPKEVETPSMSNSEGGSGHNTSVDKNPPAEVQTPTMESMEEAEEEEEGEEATKEEAHNEEESDEDVEQVDEGAFRKFFTGHESSEDRDKAMMDFHKALDEAEEAYNKAPEKVVFNRESLEKKAKENNYKGGLRIQPGGRDKSKVYVVYDKGATGFQNIASAAGGHRRETLGM